jgi:hypothetical protein
MLSRFNQAARDAAGGRSFRRSSRRAIAPDRQGPARPVDALMVSATA